MHELKLIVDLMYQGGLSYMRYSISDTAEYGDYVSGPRIVDERTRAEMKRILSEIQDGTFAKRWIEEGRRGGPEFRRLRAENADARIEGVGEELRSHMAFINPKSAPSGWADGDRAKVEALPGEGVA
jgi:ketol-acid reductoisomerase